MKVGHPGTLLGFTAAVAMFTMTAVAQQSASTAEVKVQATSVVKKQTGKSSSGVPIETAVVTLRVGYSDLSLSTNSGQALLKDRIANAARDACARVSAAFGPGGNLTDDAECIRSAISYAQPQVDTAIEEANGHKVSAR